MMGIAFAVLFPFGAIIMRLFKFRGVVWFHAGWQIFTYIVALAAFGLGIWLALLTNQLVTPNGHSIIGIIVIGALLFQPIGGFLHHYLYVKYQRPTAVGKSHRWIGRVFIILGTINGGLGLQLANEGKGKPLHIATKPNETTLGHDDTSTSDDLIQLDVLLAGPTSTPYALGLWKLHLEIPPTYPAAPPKAHFRTKIYHPNVDEATGAVCVETLKRDWDAKLTLRDVLVTVSCLLIQPNPASALNAEAGALLQEDYESFARRARLMTGIHAGVPKSLQGVVAEARNRGEEQPGEVETMVVRRRRRDDRGAGAVRRREVAKDDGEREN
ncbi:hypothetical protein B0A49_13458, partial [Cryomyces minteri]